MRKKEVSMCSFFQWIDGLEMYDKRILLFPYEFDTMPYENFKRWVPPRPNLPPMTDNEKSEASRRRTSKHATFKSGYMGLMRCIPVLKICHQMQFRASRCPAGRSLPYCVSVKFLLLKVSCLRS